MRSRSTILVLTLVASVSIANAVDAQTAADAQCSLVGPCGDVNGSGSLTAADALTVLRAAVGQPERMSCECGVIEPPVEYVNNGDGTITGDNGLTWERLWPDGLDGIHDGALVYTWSKAVEKITDLNDNEFATYTDWRLPNLAELETLYRADLHPHVDYIFHDSSCSDPYTCYSCSCMAPEPYWTALTCPVTTSAQTVRFTDGTTACAAKTTKQHVRAVRGYLLP